MYTYTYFDLLPEEIIQLIYKFLYACCLKQIKNINYSEHARTYALNVNFPTRKEQFYNFHYDFWCENCNNQLYSKCDCDYNNKLITKKTILNPYGPNYIIDELRPE